MTTAASHREFERLRRQWWWFQRTPDHRIDDDNAWAWEFLRRTGAYGRFHQQALGIQRPRSQRPAQRQAANWIRQVAVYHESIRGLAALALPLGTLDPARQWGELFLSNDRCTPSLSWAELSSDSRELIQSRDGILPRQGSPLSQYPFNVEGAILQRGLHEETANALTRSGTNSTVQGKHPGFPILPPSLTRLGYVVITFDTRAGESVRLLVRDWKQEVDKVNGDFDGYPVKALQQLVDAQDPNPANGVTFKRLCRVVPSRLQYQAQAWIPAKNYHDVEKLFRTILTPRERHKWLPACREAWAIPEQISLFGRPRSVRYPDYSDTPAGLKAKSFHPGFNTLKLGLAALDCRTIEAEFSPSGLLIPFLRQQAGGLKDQRVSTDKGLISVTRDALKSVRWRIRQIDELYSRCWLP